MRIFVGAAVLLAMGLAAARGDEGRDLFNRVAAHYSTCVSFFSEGTISQVAKKGKITQRADFLFTIRFQRPGMLMRVDWVSGSKGFSFSTVSVPSSIYTEKGKYFATPGIKSAVQELADLEMGLLYYAAKSDGVTYTVPMLLLGRTKHFDEMTCKVLPSVKVNGRECRVLELKGEGEEGWTFLLDKETEVIRRYTETQVTNGPKGQRYPVETVVDFEKPVFDGAMKEEEFVFRGK